ncbi:E domain-containing protein, partial [Staphylococcus epidermidis]|uniref:E domain-containing protein n=1 Tax=Staphylococcus epidermidis TaxID=1282 RepID=UPI00164340F6
KFNGDLKGGEEGVVEKGKKGSKRIRRGRRMNGISGEKVGEGKGREKISKDGVDEMSEFGGEEMKAGDKDVFDGNGGVDSKEDIAGKGGIKNAERG